MEEKEWFPRNSGSHKNIWVIPITGHTGKVAREMERVPTRIIRSTVGIRTDARGTMSIFKKTPIRLIRLNW